MVTATRTEQKVEVKQTSLEELGRSMGIPLRVMPWWGSLRRGRERWPCPAGGQSLKKQPEIRDGVVYLWAGPCRHQSHYHGPHTHRQAIEVKDARNQAILIAIRSCGGVVSHHLFGVDDKAAYVVRVSRRAAMVDDALQWLMPKMVKEAIIHGLDVKRQGDWFFIPRSREPNLHEWDDHLHYGQYKRNHLYKNRSLVYNGALTRHRATFVVYNSVLGLPCEAPIVKGKVRGPDHETLVLDQWHLAIRNRSHPWRNTQRENRVDD